MCGRFIVSYTYEELEMFLQNHYSIFDFKDDTYKPRYNVAPGQQVLSIISDGKAYRAGNFKWGFVPFFAKDENIGYSMINARSETVHQKSAFKTSFKQKRCIILSDGFYEWKREGKTKTPMLVQLKNKQLYAYAGLWSAYKKDDGTTVYSTTILTTNANTIMQDIHDRMPVILDEEDAKKWLDTSIQDEELLLGLLKQYQSDKMTVRQVSSYVNKVSNEGEKCIEEYIDNSLF